MCVKMLKVMTKFTPPPHRLLAPRPLGLYFAFLNTAAFIPSPADFAFSPDKLPFVTMMENFQKHMQTLPTSDTQRFLKGVERYRAYPWKRKDKRYKTFYKQHNMHVLDCGGTGEAVLLVPSVINKAYILDLMDDASLVEHLKNKGYHVYMVDWGEADAAHPKTMDDVCRFVAQAIKKLKKPWVVGYCLGGLFALAGTLLAKQKVKGLALAATPWDFSQTEFAQQLKPAYAAYELFLNGLPVVPVDVIQTQFATLAPFGAIRRMQAFGEIDDEKQLQRLTAIEDWLADGVDVDTAIAKTLILDWYGNNAPMEGKWAVDGVTITPKALNIPLLCILPQNDAIVPLGAAIAACDGVKDVNMVDVPTGHIGLMAGRKAQSHVFAPLVGWMQKT